MKRVLFITSTFPLNEKDSQAPWMAEFVRRMSSGTKIDVFAPSHEGSKNSKYCDIDVFRFRYAPSFLEILTSKEGAVFKLRAKPWLFIVAFFYIIFGLIAVIKQVKKYRYNVIHVNWPFPQGIFGLVAKWISHTPLILTFYGAEFTLINQVPLGKMILKYILKNSNHVIAISNFTKRKILELQSDITVSVIPFTSSLTVADETKEKVEKNDGENRILFVGRLIERKGISYLIDAMKYVLPVVGKVRLDIVGGGPLMSLLNKKIIEKKLDKFVFLHGKVNEEELKKFYNLCTVFVLPAIIDRWGDTEGLGVVLLEAMNFGKSVVASNVGGIPDIVKDNVNGLLVPEKDPKKLGEAIIKLLTDEKLRNNLASNSRTTVRNDFSWEKIIASTKKLYDKAY